MLVLKMNQVQEGGGWTQGLGWSLPVVNGLAGKKKQATGIFAGGAQCIFPGDSLRFVAVDFNAASDFQGGRCHFNDADWIPSLVL